MVQQEKHHKSRKTVVRSLAWSVGLSTMLLLGACSSDEPVEEVDTVQVINVLSDEEAYKKFPRTTTRSEDYIAQNFTPDEATLHEHHQLLEVIDDLQKANPSYNDLYGSYKEWLTSYKENTKLYYDFLFTTQERPESIVDSNTGRKHINLAPYNSEKLKEVQDVWFENVKEYREKLDEHNLEKFYTDMEENPESSDPDKKSPLEESMYLTMANQVEKDMKRSAPLIGERRGSKEYSTKPAVLFDANILSTDLARERFAHPVALKGIALEHTRIANTWYGKGALIQAGIQDEPRIEDPDDYVLIEVETVVTHGSLRDGVKEKEIDQVGAYVDGSNFQLVQLPKGNVGEVNPREGETVPMEDVSYLLDREDRYLGFIPTGGRMKGYVLIKRDIVESNKEAKRPAIINVDPDTKENDKSDASLDEADVQDKQSEKEKLMKRPFNKDSTAILNISTADHYIHDAIVSSFMFTTGKVGSNGTKKVKPIPSSAHIVGKQQTEPLEPISLPRASKILGADALQNPFKDHEYLELDVDGNGKPILKNKKEENTEENTSEDTTESKSETDN